MSYRRHGAELGRLIDAHRPAKAWIGWLISVLFALPFALLIGLGPPGPVAGLVVFLVIGLSICYGLGEWFFLQSLLYEHAVVLRSIPGLREYVIPHQTIDPASFEVGGRRVHEGTLRRSIETGLERRFRVTPLAASTVRFVGLHPKRAHRLAKGKLDWPATSSPAANSDNQAPMPLMNWWWASYRDPESHRQLIEDTVRRSQQSRPYQGHSG
ncbi:MAG: hypothetical protein ACRDO7_15245 [Nocardioidaceae bacterium]